ncbi:flavodoxin [Thomasclavelia ramosa]|uniref:flavodoxin n=1 Tax=Thomasclavelia ramosa TaxID=1547 RepID=UPI003AAA79F6
MQRYYEIDLENPYDEDDNTTHYQAQDEIKSENLRKIRGELPNILDYDLILIGGPVWSGRISNPLMEYLNLTDFKNINVAPFWTDAGSFEGYEEDFHKFVRNGTVLNGQGFSHVSSMSDLEIKKLIEDWTNRLS